ncbi:MAG: 5-(carboxyamino)imidazole ribonucleotide mutase [Crocinitomicaceae bacterium]|jgi:5-(carboxyamino)imidazole ribonucleotide mutase|nr:5-(carboxyamino)imidazole ribonucleotide mutase [Crocinitomicaceae bacterium]
MKEIKVGIIMGSASDLPVMKDAKEILDALGVESEVQIVSAHRTPEKMVEYAKSASKRGIKVIIAGAGGAAHLPGMTASMTTLPVIGVPIKSSNSIDGWDSILSILQMPNGIPVATVALNGAKNAGILAARIIGATDKSVENRLASYAEEMKAKVEKSQDQID